MAPQILPHHIYIDWNSHIEQTFFRLLLWNSPMLYYSHISQMKWKSSLIVFRITKSQLKRNEMIIVLRNTLKVKWDRSGSLKVKQVSFTYMTAMRLGRSISQQVTWNSNYTGRRKRSNKFQKTRNEKFPWKIHVTTFYQNSNLFLDKFFIVFCNIVIGTCGKFQQVCRRSAKPDLINESITYSSFWFVFFFAYNVKKKNFN